MTPFLLKPSLFFSQAFPHFSKLFEVIHFPEGKNELVSIFKKNPAAEIFHTRKVRYNLLYYFTELGISFSE